MFIIEPADQQSIDMDRFDTFVRSIDGLVYSLNDVGDGFEFPLLPAQLHVRNNLGIVDAADFDAEALLIRWFVSSQGWAVDVLNDQDVIRVRVEPGEAAISKDDIEKQHISLGRNLREFSTALVTALVSTDPMFPPPTNPVEKTAIWLLELDQTRPELRGPGKYDIATRNIFVWSRRKRLVFSAIGSASGLFFREEPGKDTLGVYLPDANVIFERVFEDEATDGSFRYSLWGTISLIDRIEDRRPEYIREKLLRLGRTLTNENEDEILIDLDDGVFSVKANGGTWVRAFTWKDGAVHEEDRFVPAK